MTIAQGPVRPWEATRERLLWGALILVLAGVGFAGARSALRGGLAGWGPVPPRLPVYGSVPDFTLTERSGRPAGAEALHGKVWIATFIFTHCTDTCPLQSAEMAHLQREFEAEEDFRLVSVTVDPERDSPPVLARYAAHFGAHPSRWLFLTGDRAAIHRLARGTFRLGVVEARSLEASPLDEAFPPPRLVEGEARGRLVLHSARFVLVDRASRIRGYYESGDRESLGRLREHVRTLLREA